MKAIKEGKVQVTAGVMHRIVVCAQDSDLFERCVAWLKSFFLDTSERDREHEYEFHFVSVMPKDVSDICGVMAQGLGVPKSLTSTCQEHIKGPKVAAAAGAVGHAAESQETNGIAQRAARVLSGGTTGLTYDIHVVKSGHGDTVDAERVGEAVCSMCDRLHADMVVVGRDVSNRGRKDKDLRHVFEGSVVSCLLRRCSMPVLICMQ